MHAFDKLLRKRKHNHEQEIVDKIAQVNIMDPRQFWQMIKALGAREDKGIKLEMVGEDGMLITDPMQVLGNWKEMYRELLNPAPSGDTEFKEKVVSELDIDIGDNLEAEYNQVGEIKHALKKSKNGKAEGIDRITNEVLKQDANLLELFLHLFDLCFSAGMVLSQWLQAIIPELHTTNKLPKYHRSLIIKLLLGVLPIRVKSR